MMVFSLFEFILGIKRYSFLGFSYNHWYDKWIKSWFLQTFSKSFFFYSLGWAMRHRRSLGRRATFACFGDTLLEISSFALKKTEPATQAALETVQLNRDLLRGRLRSKSMVSQTSHWSCSGSGLHSLFITAEESNFQIVLLLCFHKRERTFAISCSWWVDDWLKYPLCYTRRGPQQIKVLHP